MTDYADVRRQASMYSLALAPRGEGKGSLREHDLDLCRRIAQVALADGRRWVFWVHFTHNNLVSGGEQLDYTSEYTLPRKPVTGRGAQLVYRGRIRQKILVCGESTGWYYQHILRVRQGQETPGGHRFPNFRSDLLIRYAVAEGGLGEARNHPLGWHVWAEIVDPFGSPQLRVDVWAAGTECGPLFPGANPLGLFMTTQHNLMRLRP